MLHIEMPARPAAVISLCLALGSSVAWPIAARAQAVGAPTTFNLYIQSQRMNVAPHHPERGAVTVDELTSMRAKQPQLPLDRHLSIFVTDVETVSQIKFSEVMDQLVKQSGDPFLTKTILFHQWWDSAGQAPGLGLGPHCDDESAPDINGLSNPDLKGTSTLNGFPYRCPRLEVAEATSDPFTDESDANKNAYTAIAFSNRFDLISPPDNRKRFADCGEYRMVFARNSGKSDPLNRNLIIFEARVPNPEPEDGLNGCRPILDFWHSLSDTSMSAVDRGKKLRNFYLNGLPGVGRPVDIAHYTFGAGQIRTNQFMLNSGSPPTPVDWTLREFKTFRTNGTLIIMPDSVKTNPGNKLFEAGATDPRIGSLNQDIRAQMKNILGGAGPKKGVDDINSMGFLVTGKGANAFESDEHFRSLGDIVTAYCPGGADCPSGSVENPTLKSNIQETLTLAGSPLLPLNVVKRVRTQTCAGCHEYSNNDHDLGGKAFWPNKTKGDLTVPDDKKGHPPMRFTQESERDKDLRPAVVGSGNRYAISLTVECFLDFREAFMKKALGLAPGTPVSNCPEK